MKVMLIGWRLVIFLELAYHFEYQSFSLLNGKLQTVELPRKRQADILIVARFTAWKLKHFHNKKMILKFRKKNTECLYCL